jgi:hypothetical protein
MSQITLSSSLYKNGGKAVEFGKAVPQTAFELHPACAAWPPMSDTALAELARDIKANGLRDAITVTPDRKLLDGRNRVAASEMAGVGIPSDKIETYDGDPWLFSLSKNKHRRHLSVGQIAIVAATLAKRGRGEYAREANGSSEPFAPTEPNPSNEGFAPTTAEVAKAAGVPKTAIESAKAVLAYGAPEEVEVVRTDKAPLRRTADIVRARRLADAPPKKIPAYSANPIDDVAKALTAKCADGKWRSSVKLASAVRFAESAVKTALAQLDAGRVQTRNGANGPEYLIRQEEVSWLEMLAAKDAEIRDLKRQLAERDATITQLRTGLLSAPSHAPVLQ